MGNSTASNHSRTHLPTDCLACSKSRLFCSYSCCCGSVIRLRTLGLRARPAVGARGVPYKLAVAATSQGVGGSLHGPNQPSAHPLKVTQLPQLRGGRCPRAAFTQHRGPQVRSGRTSMWPRLPFVVAASTLDLRLVSRAVARLLSAFPYTCWSAGCLNVYAGLGVLVRKWCITVCHARSTSREGHNTRLPAGIARLAALPDRYS